MTGRDHQDPPVPPPANVPDLISDFRAQQDAWRAWESQLARLRNEILAAADRDAATIVTTARADIRRILVEARHQLLVLTSQVRAVAEGQIELNSLGEPVLRRGTEIGQWKGDQIPPGASSTEETQDRVLSARHDVRRLLEEARPDLEKLSEEAEALRKRLQPKVEERPAAASAVAPETDSVEIQPLATPIAPFQSSPYLPARSEANGGRRGWLANNVFVVVFVIAGAALLMGLGLWLRPGQPSEQQPAPVVVASTPEPSPQPVAPLPAATEPPAGDPDAPPMLSLVVEARREAWIQFTIDGELDAGRLYEPGYTRRIEGARDVMLRVGDAGAVSVSVNGQVAELLGRDGQIVTRRYTAGETPSPSGTDGPAASIPTVGNTSSILTTLEQAVPQVSTADLPPSLTVLPVTSGRALGDGSSRPLPRMDASQLAIITAGQQWLDAYYRRDSGGMAALAARDPNVADERQLNERLPEGLQSVQRVFEGVQLELFGDGALFTARMTERANIGGEPLTQTSVVSQMWVRQGGQWRLTGVRLLGQSR